MLPNPRKTLSVRHLGKIDVSRIKESVLAIPEDIWREEDADKPNRFAALDRTRHIVLRFVSDVRDWRSSYDRPAWERWRPLLMPVLDQVAVVYGYQRPAFPRIMLARMAPGGVIQPHRDQNPSAKWPHKVHVPLLTNDRVSFYIDGAEYHFGEGEVVEVNNMAVHAVKNGGTTDRIHLIFECYDLDQPEPV